MDKIHCICGQLVDSDNERNAHILSHFEKKICFCCDNDLIFLAGRWYQPHIDINCRLSANEIKQEPEGTVSDEFYEQDTVIVPIKMEESIDLSIFTPNITDGIVESTIEIHQLQSDEEHAPNESDEELLVPINEHDAQYVPAANGKSSLFPCNLCSLSFEYRYAYDNHISSAHLTGNKTNPTTTDGNKSFNQSNDRTLHVRSYPCELCDVCSLAFRQNRLKHMEDAHSTQVMNRKRGRPSSNRVHNNQLHPCSLCLAVFLHRQNRFYHMKYVHGKYNDFFQAKAELEMSCIRTNGNCAGDGGNSSQSKVELTRLSNGEKTHLENSLMTIPIEQSPKIRACDVKMWSCSICTFISAKKSNVSQHIHSKCHKDKGATVKPILDWHGTDNTLPLTDTTISPKRKRGRPSNIIDFKQ